MHKKQPFRHELQYRLLLIETALDELVPGHWREARPNHINQPLEKPENLALDNNGEKLIHSLLRALNTRVNHRRNCHS